VDSFHFLSNVQGNGFARIFSKLKWHLFSNYLPTDSIISRQKTTRKALLFVGRIIREKGVFELLSAFDKLSEKKEQYDITLWFAGDGKEMNQLREEAKNRKSDAIQLLGYVKGSDLERLYSKAYMMVLPTFWEEGFPYVVIEAMRAGLPIITTPTGVLPDIIQDSINGIIVPPKDLDSLILAIEKLLKNKYLWKSISDNNQRHFQENLSKTAAEKYYKDLLFINT
jgi:glycosyltransferase involved in cell wall biosynthesis